jgi:hypothetical protein
MARAAWHSSDFETTRTYSVAVTAAGKAGSVVMDPQLDFAQRAIGFDHRPDRSVCLTL